MASTSPNDDRGPRRTAAGHRRAVTLIEIVVVVAIIGILLGLVLVAGRGVQESSRRSRAASQMKVLADAMERYVRDWPAWHISGVKAADKGWPAWLPAMLFPTTGTPAYPNTNNAAGGFYDNVTLGRTPMNVDDDDDPTVDAFGTLVGRIDIGLMNQTLAFALTSRSRGTPTLDDGQGSMFEPIEPPFNYPQLATDPPSAAMTRRRIVDPWGAVYRYLWVVRDAQSINGWRAVTSGDPGQLADPSTGPPDPFFARAEAFVIESAGPDGRFGNVWKRNPTAVERSSAEDNVTIKP